MARFTIETDQGTLIYDTDPCALTDAEGNAVDLSPLGYREYLRGAATDNGQELFSIDSPLIGKVQPRILKIQLGLGCNYSCSYCSQGGQTEDKSSRADAREFLDGLDGWLTESPQKIEFWGGEPLLYWDKLQILAPELRTRFPDARMSIVTNGTLLTAERADWLHGLGFSMAVSHDGPGQDKRGKDPFENSEWAEMIRAVAQLFDDRFCINTVVTPGNHDLFAIAMWFADRFGFDVKVNIEDVVTDYGGASWTGEQLREMETSMREQVTSGIAFHFPRLRWSAQQFLESLVVSKPLAGSQQVCGMARRDQLAVDLKGAVLTCQNAGAKSGHTIGSVSALGDVALAAHPWATRNKCTDCPVVHLCYGSCMLLPEGGLELKNSCAASYYYNMGILGGLIQRLTGAKVRSVSGARPHPVISLKVAA
jgi:uncharacterized protein